jgi:hypothetical protein
MSPPPAAAQASAPRPVRSPDEARLLINHFHDVMDALLAIIEEETELVRAGKLSEAAKLETAKAELSRLYAADSERIRASQAYLAEVAPDMLADLRRRHDEFRAVLQMNLTVLATAHAVSESIMRGVSDELARRATPQAYGASGHPAAPSAAARQPLALSRVL